MKRKYLKPLFFYLAIIYTTALITVSVIRIKPETIEPVNFKNADKVFHFSVYFGLTILWQLYYYIKQENKKKGLSLKILLAIIGFGIVIEVVQDRLTNYRGFEYLDIVANTSGAILAFTLLLLLKPFYKLKL